MSEAQLAGALERATAAEEVASKYSSDVQRISEQVTKLGSRQGVWSFSAQSS